MRGTLKIFICLLLPIVALAAAAPRPARAQQPEKRIALVVGNGAYAKSPLATTANDAGLIAQTLQAAGFDVVGARDLDGDTLRKSFRDFIQKARSSGPGTVAMIYLAGYGVQLAGENYFIPVDSNITRDTDVPTEALRISDYVRQLATIPLKADIVVLDAARAQPFIEGGQPIASGLALVEPEANMLIAFNAAPGTVAPEEPGPYGIYAQSLAEMIRTGGLPLPEVFDRVRLRVNEASKGAQVPWNEQKISAPFSFFERGPDAPPEAAPDQVAAIRSKPIRDLGVRDAYAAALERDTLPVYEEFLAAYPGDPLAKRVMAIVAARREAITWRRSYRIDTPEAYWSYLRRYPRGPHAADARRRLAILTAPAEPPPSFAMIDYDVPPPPPEEVVYVDRPVLYFSDPDFDFAPPPPPPVYYLPPPPPDFVVLPPPLPVVGLFVLPQPVFVPIPVFVRPPVYVAPPPNNIIYQNIHNTTVINTVINQPPAPPPAAGPAGPANLAPAVAGRANPAGPAVPQAVAQRAALIQQGKAPLPPSATIQPTARPGSTAPARANVGPAAAPSVPATPQANTLPAPGSHGGSPAGSRTTPGGVAPNGNSGPTATAPAGNTPAATPKASAPAKLPQANTLPVPGTPGGPPPPARAGAVPGAAPPHGKPGSTATAPAGPVPPAPNHAPVAGARTPPSAGLPRPPGTSTPPVTDVHGRPAGPRPGALPPPKAVTGKPAVPTTAKLVAPPPPVAARAPSRVQDHRPMPPQQAVRPAAPPPHPQALTRPTPPPPPRAAPPHPPVAVARPAPPPPVARPAPPPPPIARAAPPPPVARPAPPPMAAAPPRPAPPARPAGPAPKRCPPGQPKC